MTAVDPVGSVTQDAPPDEYVECDLAELAEERGCDLIVADERTLLLDLDNDHARRVFDRNLPKVKDKYPVESVERYPSRSVGHEHVIVGLLHPVPDATTRLLLQAALGSDATRELLSLYRVKRNHSTPSVLFRPRANADGAATEPCQ